MTNAIQVGVSQWHRFGVGGEFYPEDIPDEWRLAYFANEFSTACVDLDDLSREYDNWSELFEDLPQDFQLSLKIQSKTSQELFVNLLDQLPVKVTHVLTETEWPEFQLPAPINIISYEQIWLPDRPVEDAPIALIPAGQSLKQYRWWIEQWLECSRDSDQSLTLWGEGGGWSYTTLGEVKTLVELMGH